MRCGIYQHYKGGYYQLIGVGAHSETDERFVVYISLSGMHCSGPRIRIRPINLWLDLVTWPDGVKGERFRYVGEELK